MRTKGSMGSPCPFLMTKVELAHVWHTYGNTEVVRDISFHIESGEFITLIGPSGCGKSTLLQIIAGLIQPTTGTILFNQQPIASRLGRTGYMPQADTLFPWRTVLNNVVLGAEIQRQSLRAARQRARERLPLFGLKGFANAFPAQLSGGMRQRAAFLRTFMIETDIILLDEPFGALDALTRMEMQTWLLDIWQHFGYTILFVTHDIREAVVLSDRIIALSSRPGEILETVAVPFNRKTRLNDFTVDMVQLENQLFQLLKHA